MNEIYNFFKNKKVLITGSTGFIGTNLTRRLSDMGATIIGITHKKSPQIHLENVRYINADLTKNYECHKVCENIDYIFMCAANSSGAAVIESAPLTHLTPNIVMNAYMLEAAYANKVKKFAFISSNTVYPLTDFAVTESDINYKFFEKYHIVGWMKLFSEEMCKMYSEHIKNTMHTLIIRPGNLYGPFDKYNTNESKVIAALIRRFAENQNPLDVWGDGEDIKDFLYIDDFIDGLLMAFIIDGVDFPLNIASGIPLTIKDVINNLAEISNIKDLKVNYDKSKPSMIPKRMISVALANEVLDWKPKINLKQGLEKTLAWYKLYYAHKSPDTL